MYFIWKSFLWRICRSVSPATFFINFNDVVNDEGRREPFANLKDLDTVIREKWHAVDDQTVRKAILQWKRRLAAVAKQTEGPIRHISAS